MEVQKQIAFYTEKGLIHAGQSHATILFPFYGNPETNSMDADFGRFDEYTAKGKAFFSLVENPVDADYFLLPYEFSFSEESMKQTVLFSEKAKKMNKKVVVFFNSDSMQEIPIENAIVFRTSFYKSKQKKNEFAIPGWSIDFMKLKKDLKETSSSEPSISYCGYVDYITLSEKYNIKKSIKRIVSKSNANEDIGPKLRGKAVRLLIKNKEIKTNFIIRNGFWAPGMDKKMARQEYVNNIFQSNYALVARGGGNFSYRLYEVLSCGRIPVFINTDCVLPFDTIIDWKKYVLWIEESDMKSISEKLLEFHSKMNPDELSQKKAACRKLYDTWLSPLAFFSNIYKCLN